MEEWDVVGSGVGVGSLGVSGAHQVCLLILS